MVMGKKVVVLPCPPEVFHTGMMYLIVIHMYMF